MKKNSSYLGMMFFLINCFWLNTISAAEIPHVVILGNNNSVAYQSTIKGFRTTLNEKIPKVNIIDYNQTPLSSPSLVFALGEKAIRVWHDNFNEIDVIATLIFNDDLLKNNIKGTTVQLNRSALTQLKWVQKILPKTRIVGVLYDPKLNQTWINQAQIDAATLGIELLAVKVNSAKDLTTSLNIIGRQADVILGIRDETVFSSKTAQKILLYSYNNRMPFIGISGNWAKAGALFALDWDYEELGKQSARIAIKKLNGEKTASENASKTTYRINLKTARQLKIDISKDIINNAAVVYR